jgi:hypothetical protein
MGKGVPGETEEALAPRAAPSIVRSVGVVRLPVASRPLREVRYPANPSAAKPISIVAHVEGSGMATITPSSAPIP